MPGRPLAHPLIDLGYEPVLQKQDIQERKLLFTLFKRKAAPASEPASGAATSQASQR